jgi:Flp pilus assembly protein TadB
MLFSMPRSGGDRIPLSTPASALSRGARQDDGAVAHGVFPPLSTHPTIWTSGRVVPRQQSAQVWRRYIPFHDQLELLVEQSGTKVPLERLLLTVGIVDLAVLVALAFLLPFEWRWLSIPIGAVAGIGPALFYLRRARKKRIDAFTDQLPDALDLIVRSLKIGHPLNGAMSVVAAEMPAPIGPEFAIA